MRNGWISKLILAAALGAGVPAWGGADHHHEKGPRGGEVRTFGELHLEAIRTGAAIKLHVLGADGKTPAAVAKHDGGTVTVVAPGQPAQKTEVAAGTELKELDVTVPPSGKVTVLVSLKTGGKPVSAKFSFR